MSRGACPARLNAAARRTHPTSIVLGRAIATKRPYCLPLDAFRRGVHVLGAIGAGKTSLLRRYLMALGSDPPWVHCDFIGTGHRHLETLIAARGTLIAAAERCCPERAGATTALLSRYAFLSIGATNPAVRFDLLRRRRLPDGSRETVRDVTGRALEVLFTKLNDPDAALRVRFRRVATALIACLVGAERPITEAIRVLDDAAYMAFLERELHARSFRPSDHRFLTHQLAELHHVLLLRPTDPTKSWRAFEDMTESTRNSLADFAPGTLLGELFGTETVPLESIAFGRTCLSVTTRHADDTLKSQAFQAIHAMLHALCLHRQDLARPRPLTYIVDEPRWVRRHFPGVLAVSRNLGVSYVVSHQSLAQWEDIGLPAMPREMRALTNLQITFRPTSIGDAEDEMLHTRVFRPDGMVLRFTVSGSSSGGSDSFTMSSGWSDALRRLDDSGGIDRTDGTTGGEASTEGSSWQETEHEVLNVVGFRDQLAYAAQAALRRPRFTGAIVLDGVGTEIAFAPTPEFPATFAGVPILEHYRTWHDRYWRARLVPRTPYDPHAALCGPDVPAVEASPDTKERDALNASCAPEEPHRTPRAPVPAPTFVPRPSGQPTGRRRRRRGGKRDA